MILNLNTSSRWRLNYRSRAVVGRGVPACRKARASIVAMGNLSQSRKCWSYIDSGADLCLSLCLWHSGAKTLWQVACSSQRDRYLPRHPPSEEHMIKVSRSNDEYIESDVRINVSLLARRDFDWISCLLYDLYCEWSDIYFMASLRFAFNSFGAKLAKGVLWRNLFNL